MNLPIFTLVAGVAMASSSYAQPIPSPPVPITPHVLPQIPEPPEGYIAGNWSYPPIDDMQAAYPAKALDDEVDGQVKIDCLVAVTGRLISCKVLSETPAGYGFGTATAGLFVKFTHVDIMSVPGGIKPGVRHQFTYDWHF